MAVRTRFPRRPTATIRRPHVGATRGITLIELAVVLAIATTLISLSVMAFGNFKSSVKAKNVSGDFLSTLGHARARALARQRTQLIVIDAVAGANGTYGFYHFEDAAQPPNVFAPTNLSAILATLNPSQPSTAPNPYVLLLVDSNYDSANPYLAATNGWPNALPFPFTPLSINTTGGCSFCSVGTGAIAFLPNGRAIFSDGNATGGLVVLQSVARNGVATGQAGLAISPTGFVQKLVP
jgi:Tfp pilus assembly protein PilE